MIKLIDYLLNNKLVVNTDIYGVIENQVLAYVHIHPRLSVRHVGHEVGISKSLIYKILKKNKLHFYKPDLLQHLHITDPEQKFNLIY